MDIQSANTKKWDFTGAPPPTLSIYIPPDTIVEGSVATPTKLLPKPAERQSPETPLEEYARLVAERLGKAFQSIAQAFNQAFKPIVDAWANLGNAQKKHMSKQTRLFLATKYKEPHFTPHAQRRRRSQRRMKAILARV